MSELSPSVEPSSTKIDVPERKTSRSLGLRIIGTKAGKLAAVGAAVAVAVTGVASKTGLKGDEQSSSMEGKVVDIKPIAFDCRAIMTTEIGGHIANSVNLSALGVIDVNVKGTGFDSYLRNAAGTEGSKAVAETLVCMDKPQAMIDNKARTVALDTANVRLFSRYVENQSSVVTEDPPISAMGEGIGKFVRGATGGKITLWDGFTNTQRARLESTTRQVGINTVETKCAPNAWSLTKTVIEDSYKQQDPNVSVNWTGSDPSFRPPYEVGGADSFFDIDQNKLAVNECVVDGALLEQFADSGYEYKPVDPRLARAGE